MIIIKTPYFINLLLKFSYFNAIGNRIICILLIFTLAGCNNKDVKPKWKIGFSQCCDDPWRTVMKVEMQRELAFHPELGFSSTNSKSNSEQQIIDIKNLVAEGIDLLIVSPNEAKPLSKILDSLFNTGLPIVLIDRSTDTKYCTVFIGADNEEIGKLAAKYLEEKHPEGVNAIELQIGLTMTPAQERSRGFESTFTSNPKNKIITAFEDIVGIEKFQSKFLNVINSDSSINAVFAHTDAIAINASKWIKEAKKNKAITIIGVDALPGEGNGIQAVENKVINASLQYPTGGSESIQVALSILNKLPFERFIKLNSILIDESNARTIQLQMSKIEGLQQTINQQIKFNASFQKLFRTQKNFIFFLGLSLFVAFLLGWFLWRSLKTKQQAYAELSVVNIEVTQKQLQLLKMTEELEIATNAKVDFYTNISHEIRTPLTLITAISDDLSTKKYPVKEFNQSLGIIKQNSNRLLHLINELMDFNKIEKNKLVLKVHEGNIIEFIKNIAASFSNLAKSKNIEFEVFAKNEEILLWFEPASLDKVFFNIISNAFKFTPVGGRITVGIIKDNFENKIKIAIEDNGSGIQESDQLFIFEPFYQSQFNQANGTGIGLSLAKSLVELHSGTIDVNSIYGKGSRFTVTFRMGKEHFDPSQLSNTKVELIPDHFQLSEFANELQDYATNRESSNDYNLLIIEDNVGLQHFLQKILGSKYKVIGALSGEDGIDKAMEYLPDLIICDLTLPVMDGIEVLDRLKSDIRTSHIPIIVLTARASMENQVLGTKAGADAYLSKPFNTMLLWETINNLLHNRQILKEAYSQDTINLNENISMSNLDKDFLIVLNNYLNNNFFKSEFQINDLCKEVNLSRSQLYRKAKSLLGKNISDIILNKRMAKAETLLMKENITVAEIAYQCGYSSPDYFSTAFKQKYGMSPSQFRKDV